MTQKVRKGVSNGSERQKGGKWWWIEQKIDRKTLNVELKPQLRTLNNNNNNNNKQIMALNTKWRCGSERRNERYQWLWTPNRKWTMAWNAKRSKIWLWTPNENTTLNVKLRSNNGSERRNWEVIMMALNVETKNATRITLNTDTDEWWPWTPNEDAMMALNVETGKATLNVKLGNDDGFERWNQETRHWWLSGAKTENATLNVNLGSDDGSESRH